MKVLYALYDGNDNFVNCGFSLEECGVKHCNSWFWQHTIKKWKLYRIPLEPVNDCFQMEDELFVKEFEDKCFTNEEQAKRDGISIRTLFRRKEKLKELQNER